MTDDQNPPSPKTDLTENTDMSEYNVDEVIKNIFGSEDLKWKPADVIPLVNKEIEKRKEDLINFLNNSGYDIEDILKECELVRDESRELLEDMEECRREIEEETMVEIIKSIENHNLISQELESVEYALTIVTEVFFCNQYLQQYEEAKKGRGFLNAVDGICKLVGLINNCSDGFKSLDIYPHMSNTAKIIFGSLVQELFIEWDKWVFYNMKTESGKTEVIITLDISASPMVMDMLNALELCEKLKEKTIEFSQFLLQEVIIPIILNECTVYAETNENMIVTINHNNRTNKPPYNAVIANLRLLLHFLSNKLNIVYRDDETIMKLIGREISQKFCQSLVKDCLLDTVPNTINELQTYGHITSEIEDFQRFLSVIKLFPDDNSINILEYINNIDDLFAKKSSRHFLDVARQIMLKDLSETMSIGVETIPENEEVVAVMDESIEHALAIFENTIPKSLFYFPRCMISKTAQELLDLVNAIMEQAVQCSEVVCKKLYFTTRLIFEMYEAVVPYHHENYLQMIPQYVALFHNNCMYLAHKLLTFGDKWSVLMEGLPPDYTISYLDLVYKLRELGCSQLAAHMRHQRNLVLDSIRSSDLNNFAGKDTLGPSAEAAVRQCLRQLQLLRNVWIGVFPRNVFTRLMSTMVNMTVDELVHRTCSAEDISVEMATQLADMFKLVVQKAPNLFQDPSDIEAHVKTWIKLQELIFVLSGSLKDIEAHWADGTGPLAVHFRTEELRSLIKALFQNTQFRANLLAKIK